jgi:hypothetical protein
MSLFSQPHGGAGRAYSVGQVVTKDQTTSYDYMPPRL